MIGRASSGSALATCAALALLAACGAQQPAPAQPAPAPVAQPAAPAKPIVGVALTVTPADAQVFLDEADPREASTLPAVVPLPAGLHQLIISHDGYTSYRAEFSVSNKTETFTVRLEPAKH